MTKLFTCQCRTFQVKNLCVLYRSINIDTMFRQGLRSTVNVAIIGLKQRSIVSERKFKDF